MKRYIKTEIIKEVDEVIKDNSLSSLPIDLNMICSANKIAVHKVCFNHMEGRLKHPLFGLITNLDGDFEILFNEKDMPRRQRFTIAHELGHFFLHLDKTGNQTIICLKDEFDWLETEANNFAAELLMPREMFLLELLKLLEKYRKPLEDCKARVIQGLSDIFEVPFEAAKIRVKELQKEMNYE